MGCCPKIDFRNGESLSRGLTPGAVPAGHRRRRSRFPVATDQAASLHLDRFLRGSMRDRRSARSNGPGTTHHEQTVDVSFRNVTESEFQNFSLLKVRAVA